MSYYFSKTIAMPFDQAISHVTAALVDEPDVPFALRYFGGAGLAHMREYGTRLETFAKIRAKASRHAANNPLALFRTVVSTEAKTGTYAGIATFCSIAPIWTIDIIAWLDPCENRFQVTRPTKKKIAKTPECPDPMSGAPARKMTANTVL